MCNRLSHLGGDLLWTNGSWQRRSTRGRKREWHADFLLTCDTLVTILVAVHVRSLVALPLRQGAWARHAVVRSASGEAPNPVVDTSTRRWARTQATARAAPGSRNAVSTLSPNALNPRASAAGYSSLFFGRRPFENVPVEQRFSTDSRRIFDAFELANRAKRLLGRRLTNPYFRPPSAAGERDLLPRASFSPLIIMLRCGWSPINLA